MISCSHKDAERRELQRLVQEYLDKGGAITVCPPGKKSREYPVSSFYIAEQEDRVSWQEVASKYDSLGNGSYKRKAVHPDA